MGSRAPGRAREPCPQRGCKIFSCTGHPGWVVEAGAWRAGHGWRGAEPAAGGAVPGLRSGPRWPPPEAAEESGRREGRASPTPAWALTVSEQPTLRRIPGEGVWSLGLRVPSPGRGLVPRFLLSHIVKLENIPGTSLHAGAARFFPEGLREDATRRLYSGNAGIGCPGGMRVSALCIIQPVVRG